ncbi:MAG TPA: sigma-70 family RNA polymerase sigma factor, partial [Verrucomicrobiales bacterium]|nr:sigma-70 family RNA polymerase sigma factor [Verrucomicrobiales bacterium]
MNAPADSELLSAYASQGEEQAFREFVQRHASWVLGVATRAAGGDLPLGEEIGQTVFCLAAKKAAALASGRVVVAAWLHRTTLLTAANAVRGEARRRRRLDQFTDQFHPPVMNEDESALWQEVLPHLDGALNTLREGDRALLLQRFFERRTVAGMAHTAGISEAACQKRLSRALQRLASVLKHRKVAVSSVMLGTLLTVPLCGPASAAVVRSLADAALPASGKVSIAAYAVSAPLAGLSVSYLLTAAAALVAFTAPVGLQAWENRKMQASVSALAVPPKETTGKKEGALPQDPALTALAASLRALKPSDHEGLLELVLLTSGLPKESLPGAWEL